MTKAVFETQANWDAAFAHMGYFFESENAFRNPFLFCFYWPNPQALKKLPQEFTMVG